MIANQNLYAPGQSYYKTLASQFGAGAADLVWVAAQTGDVTKLNAALSDARTSQRTGTPMADVSSMYYSGSAAGYNNGSDSTLGVLFGQLTTDPLRAPAESANKLLQNSFFDLLKNPFVLLAIGAVIFFALGGWNFAKRKLSTA